MVFTEIYAFCFDSVLRISLGGFRFPLVDAAVNRADWHGCQESIDQHRDVLPMRAKGYNEIHKK
ncbi:MAG: hypothetical protein ACI9NA_000672 [Gammaproteobacteria bacterium]|jgi:hypothetical protein